jgi:hypothetical protein
MHARTLMFATTALLSAAILWFPAGDTVLAATPVWSPPALLCDFGCGCSVSLGSEFEETTAPVCYDETTMTILSSTPGCCAECSVADDCDWTVEISVTNTPGNECCYQIIKDGTPPALYSNSCSDSFDDQDSDSAPCGSNHRYVVRAEGAECPHDPDAECLTLEDSVLVWSQRVHCNASGINCP